MRLLVKIAAGLAGLYLALLAAMLGVMSLPPGHSARIISYAPPPLVFLFIPFRQLWDLARDGSLEVGDLAPDFDLETHDHKGRVRLSSFRGQKPVALVFGSYT